MQHYAAQFRAVDQSFFYMFMHFLHMSVPGILPEILGLGVKLENLHGSSPYVH